MNRISMQCWIYGNADECLKGAKDFFQNLRTGLEEGKAFPMECPYQVYLLQNKVANESIVAIVLMDGTQEDYSIKQDTKLGQWFDDCNAGRGDDHTSKLIFGSSIQSTLKHSGLTYLYIDSFGTLDLQKKSKQQSETAHRSINVSKKWWQIWK